MLRNMVCTIAMFAMCSSAFAVNLIKYVSTGIEITANKKTLLKHHGIVEVGSSVRAISTPKASGEVATRIDYRITDIGVSEDGLPVAIVEGTGYSGTQDGSWTVLSEFKVSTLLGRPATMTLTRQSGSEVVLGIKVEAITEQALKAKFGGSIPKASACQPASNQSASAPANSSVGTNARVSTSGLQPLSTTDNCCTVQCNNGASSTLLTCCGAIWCCDAAGGPDCCCSPPG